MGNAGDSAPCRDGAGARVQLADCLKRRAKTDLREIAQIETTYARCACHVARIACDHADIVVAALMAMNVTRCCARSRSASDSLRTGRARARDHATSFRRGKQAAPFAARAPGSARIAATTVGAATRCAVPWQWPSITAETSAVCAALRPSVPSRRYPHPAAQPRKRKALRSPQRPHRVRTAADFPQAKRKGAPCGAPLLDRATARRCALAPLSAYSSSLSTCSA